MKKSLSLFLFLSFLSNVYSQNKAIDPLYIKSLEQKINTHLEFLSDAELNLIVNYSDTNPFISEYWDTERYNPYPTPIKNIPFQLLFKDSTYASPILIDKVITSRYGWRNRRPHKGIDIDLVTGDTVRAILDGKVRYVNYHSGHGKTVIVRHSNGLELVYAHLSKQLVKENDLVFKGQVIGHGGVTGNARGSHLHLEVIYKGNYINPEYLFDFSKDNKIRSNEFWVTNKWTSPHLHSSKRKSNIKVATTFKEATLQKVAKVRTHKIRRGDSLSRIAKKYGVSVSALCKANGISRKTILRPGKRLIIGL
ncbi:M23 family metallopeptidase [Aureibaculum sp. 2210JD6-5]|uniref:M23 family metallopeptidase n=1 Tax=Aureibaculum sp. 2210JD6-5 TaxID=3103957 RepID=UPI002AAD150A|nr:M23 family metallopeptidase [Aureibaculum sp. 2210JD6-5]MDY7394113.1 M23 family metallopeptidase [Aureibaculum sp. 2210JD6-5]